MHTYHAPDFRIVLPKNFDMKKYENLRGDRKSLIEYVDKTIPADVFLNYQNPDSNKDIS